MKRAIYFAMGAIAAAVLAAPAVAADGKAVYEKGCKGCHTAMNPKLGDKAAWAPLNKKGVDELLAVVIKGKAPMPPKGGQASASNEDLKAAVEYMMSQGK